MSLKESRTIKVPAEKYQIDTIITACPQMKSLAIRALKYEDLEARTRVGEIRWKQFEDGMPNLMIKEISEIQGRDCVFIADFLDPKEMFEQLSVIYALPRYFVRSLTIILPYFPTGTMERVDEEGQIATAYTLATMLSATPLSIMGPARLVIFDIHALQNRFYFGSQIIPLLQTAIPLFKEALKANHKGEDIAIAFPDEGASKRFGKMFKKWDNIICTKVREGDKRIVCVKEGNVAGKSVFIVDDLVKTGGTLLQCKGALLKQGAKSVSAFVTHPVFPQDSWKRFTSEKENPFKHFYVTDSCPTVSSVLAGKKPFTVLSLETLIANVISTYTTGI